MIKLGIGEKVCEGIRWYRAEVFIDNEPFTMRWNDDIQDAIDDLVWLKNRLGIVDPVEAEAA